MNAIADLDPSASCAQQGEAVDANVVADADVLRVEEYDRSMNLDAAPEAAKAEPLKFVD
jgi:hypothetical protein